MKKVIRMIRSSLLILVLLIASFVHVHAQDTLQIYLTNGDVLPDGQSLVSGKTIEVTAGEIVRLYPSLDGGKSRILADTEVKWTSSDDHVAHPNTFTDKSYVMQDGEWQLVTYNYTFLSCEKAGTGVITVTTGDLTTSFTVNVVSPSSIDIYDGDEKLTNTTIGLSVKEKRSFIARVEPHHDYAETFANWKTGDYTIASESPAGFPYYTNRICYTEVTGVKAGNTTLSASAGGITAYADIEVVEAESAIYELSDKKDITGQTIELNIGESINLYATLSPNHDSSKGYYATWESSNTDAVTVEGTGTVTVWAVGAGTSVITATVNTNGKSAQVTITVKVIPWDTLSEKLKRSSYGFFKWKAENSTNELERATANDAAMILEKSSLPEEKDIGGVNDATSLLNAYRGAMAAEGINQFRSGLTNEPCRVDLEAGKGRICDDAQKRLTPMLTSDVFMAMAQANADYSSGVIGHSGQDFSFSRYGMTSSENAAWNYYLFTRDENHNETMIPAAASQWYSEINLYNQNPSFSVAGHYMNLTNKTYSSYVEMKYTGFGVETSNRLYPYTMVQDYLAENRGYAGYAESTSDYLAKLKEYIQLVSPIILGSPFVDVNVDTPHADDVLWMHSNNISEGWLEADGTRTYRPMNAVVRQDMAAFLRREAIKLGVEDADTWEPSAADWKTFKDVNKSTPHAEDILWLAHAGISTGWTEADGTKTYRGMDTVKRQDMAAFLHRLANLAGIDKTGTMSFNDVNDSTPHAEDIYWLGGTGISTGYSDGTYQGMWPVYRQDMAAFMHRLDNLNN